MPSDLMLYSGAIILGALHAFEPGHGKTLIAAYMIGTKGRAVDGILLGLIVTFTHTFSVIILGIAAKLLAHSYSEIQLHAWLGLGSSAIILIVGIWMLKQRLSRNSSHNHIHLFGSGHIHHDHLQHSHEHSHEHSHTLTDHEHSHTHPHPHHHDHQDQQNTAVTPAERYNKWNLLLLGISGGLIPCPAAIATLLAAIGAGKIAKGLTVTLFFSLGLGLVMMTIGLILSQASRLTEKIGGNQELSRRLGIFSALIIISLGGYTMFNSITWVMSLK
ncbi:sulfite exporter TauE/SafE family protein [Desulfobacterota bacterium M19]